MTCSGVVVWTAGMAWRLLGCCTGAPVGVALRTWWTVWLIRSRTCDGSRIDSRTAVTRCLGRNGGGSKAACGRGQGSGIRSGTSRIGLPPLNVSMPGLVGSLPGSHLDWPCGKADPACGSRNGGGFLQGIAGSISHVGLPGDIRWKPTREDAIWVGEAIVTGAAGSLDSPSEE